MSEVTPVEELPKLSFAEMKTCAADDLRAVAEILNKRAAEVDAGDMDAFDAALDDIGKCFEMLVLRQGVREERRDL